MGASGSREMPCPACGKTAIAVEGKKSSNNNFSLLSAFTKDRVDIWTCSSCKYEVIDHVSAQGIFGSLESSASRMSSRCPNGHDCKEEFPPENNDTGRPPRIAHTTYCTRSKKCDPCEAKLQKLTADLGPMKLFFISRAGNTAPRNTIVFARAETTMHDLRGNLAQCFCAGAPAAPVFTAPPSESTFKFWFNKIEVADETMTLSALGITDNCIVEMGYY